MVKSEERKRSDTSLLRVDSAFVLRSPIYFAITARIPMPSVTRWSAAIEQLITVDARFACATEFERWASKVMPSYLAAVPGKAASFGLGPEWLSLKRKSQECCG